MYFWKLKENFILGAIPATLLTDNIRKYGFSTLPQHIQCQLTSPSFQTSTNSNLISWSYDTMVNLATNQDDSTIVMSKDLTASTDESYGLNLRDGEDS